MFRQPARAQRNLAGLEPYLSPETKETLNSLLAQSPDPDAALDYLGRYLAAGGVGVENPSRLNALIAVFANSHFLSEALFRHPEVLEWALEQGRLFRVLRGDELRAQLAPSRLEPLGRQSVALEMARFKRQNLLRIMLRDVLGLATLAEVTLELSTLADTLIEAGLERTYAELAKEYGRPLLAADGSAECGFTVLALGKLGGQELNYSSDIDLMYLFSGPGETAGPRKITNKEFSIKLANQLTGLLSLNTTEGFCYRVDLRLRPEGKLGEVAHSLSGALDYYQRRARDWELQMLIKARVAGGSRALGSKFLRLIQPLIYKTTTDFSAIESVAETRERIHEKLRRRTPTGLNIKLSHGGIRDIEFLVQCLQRLYGGRDPWVRYGGTQVALHRLRDKGYLTAQDYARLNNAYLFLRTVEHRLQLEHDRQTHTLPQDEEALETLAQKVGAGTGEGATSLLDQAQGHLREVTEIYDRVIHGHGPGPAPAAESPPLFKLEMESRQEVSELSMQAQLRYLEMRAPALAARIAEAPLRRGRRLFEHFLAKVVSMTDLLSAIEQEPELIDLAVDLFEHSPFFAEWLIRHPEEIHQLSKVAAFAPSDQQGELFPQEPGRGTLGLGNPPELEHLIRTRAPVSDKSAWLRRFYRRQMLRIQTESVCRRSPIFATLEQTTQLADWVVQAAYHIAVDEVLGARPQHWMHVVALGRLGMREFDLGSDADLVFIVPDAAKGELDRWARVAERLIEVLASYTGEGVIFTVDPRLRPLGGEGELVQTESAYKKYFADQAQAWEAITYMKSRCLAGDVEKGTAFLHDLQNVDWRRYGQSGTLASLLWEMRRKLEKEQGAEQPLKAGRGGYYDIDFVLMYLRLRGAGIFYTSLNTPERVDVIERMGWLGPENADFLQKAAVFYRALDHGLRLLSGRPLGTLPKARSQYEILTELVRRWTPPSLHDLPLEELLAQTRQRTREIFSGIFEGR